MRYSLSRSCSQWSCPPAALRHFRWPMAPTERTRLSCTVTESAGTRAIPDRVGHVVRVLPNRLAGIGFKAEHTLDFARRPLGAPIGHVDAAAGDRGTAVTGADRHRPAALHDIALQRAHQSVFAEHRVPVLSSPLRPVLAVRDVGSEDHKPRGQKQWVTHLYLKG